MSAAYQVADGPVITSNGDGQVRDEVMAKARCEVAELAHQGLSAREIENRLQDGFNEIESELVWLLASHEVDHARRRASSF
jgi:hypothetical protein